VGLFLGGGGGGGGGGGMMEGGDGQPREPPDMKYHWSTWRKGARGEILSIASPSRFSPFLFPPVVTRRPHTSLAG